MDELNLAIEKCERCDRLRDHCREVARTKRKAYRDWEYWGRPVSNFGDANARLFVVGLAPGAHGANRTGRMFTGDRSGDWLYRALYRAGFASQAESESRNDGLRLIDCLITAACHCAPPQNRPSRAELAECRPWLEATTNLVPFRVAVCLGQVAWQAMMRLARDSAWWEGSLPKFAHGEEVELGSGRHVMACYHPSQQNTFTGRLTEPMLDGVFGRARALINAHPAGRQEDGY